MPTKKREDKPPHAVGPASPAPLSRDADIVMFLYRDDYYKRGFEKRNIAECIVAKNRHGDRQGGAALDAEYTTFGTLENRYDEE